jgi:dihydrofolate reductase
MRKVIAELATSADGYIARPDGGVEWLDRPRLEGDYGMTAFYRSIDTILWGRKTYEVALGFQRQGITGAAFDPHKTNYVFSHGALPDLPREVTPVSESVPDFLRTFRTQPGKHAWMMGGAGLIGSFLDAGGIDEFIMHVMPVFIGEGIPVLAPRHREVPLTLKACRRFATGVVRLHYIVGDRPSGRRGR